MNNKKISIPINQNNVKIQNSFKIVEAPPQITMNNPEFEKLTAAEKLNDSNYRSLVYRTYPNEPTCGCTQQAHVQLSSNPTVTIDNHHNHSSVNFLLECPGGCKNSCCSTLRRSPIANNENHGNDDKVTEGSIASLFHCIENHRSYGFYNRSYYPDERIRGGGGGSGSSDSVEEMYRAKWINHNNSWRQRGVTCPATSSRFTDHSPELHGIEINKLNGNSIPEYHCPGVQSLINKIPITFHESKWKKPCFEIDRLTRVLKDTQKFVDSLGKIPGLAGLGLMDPTESPYFRKNKENTDEQITQITNDNNLMQLPMNNSLYEEPYNPHIKSPLSTSPWIKATPFTISVPGHGGIVREEILPMKQDKINTNESKKIIETGPCGEINCKSRRKMIINHDVPMNKVEGTEELNHVIDKDNLKKEKRYNRYRHRTRRDNSSGLHTDEFFKSKKSRRLHYVYFAGETYPGFIHGHKNCNERYKRVPANMGWLWTQYQPVSGLKPRVGWRPGAISRLIRDMIREAKVGLERSRRRPSSVPSIGSRGRKLKTRSHASLKKGHSRKLDEEKEELEPPPTLYIRRRDGAYYITMYPIKQETMDVPKLEEPMKPLQFTIPRKTNDYSDASSSTASDIDIEFSPPAAMNRYKKKPNVIHVETQVKQQDIIDIFKIQDSKRKQMKVNEVMIKKKKKTSKT